VIYPLNLTDSILFEKHDKSLPFNSMHCIVLYPQNGDCIVTIDPVASFYPVVKVNRRIRWHYTTTILRLRIGARLTRYRNGKFHNFARTISRHADGISRYCIPSSARPLLPLILPYVLATSRSLSAGVKLGGSHRISDPAPLI